MHVKLSFWTICVRGCFVIISVEYKSSHWQTDYVGHESQECTLIIHADEKPQNEMVAKGSKQSSKSTVSHSKQRTDKYNRALYGWFCICNVVVGSDYNIKSS